jgi:hypothetical protein
MKVMDFRHITPCGECCIGCLKKENGFCKGCIETSGKCEEWTGSGGCPIYLCANKHNVKFCGLCLEFPCEFLVKKVTWNKVIVKHLAKLAEEYKNIGGLSDDKDDR